MTSTLELEFEFSSAHFYQNPNWSDQKNRDVFGKCFSQYGHGHNYRLFIVLVAQKPFTISEIREQIQKTVDLLDHKHLNFDLNNFQNKVPTTEIIAKYIFEQLKPSKLYDLQEVRLEEDPQIGAIVSKPPL